MPDPCPNVNEEHSDYPSLLTLDMILGADGLILIASGT
jgi:hypothetical protein